MQCPLCGEYDVSTYRYDVLSDLAPGKYWCHDCSVYFDFPLSMKNKAATPEPMPTIPTNQEIVCPACESTNVIKCHGRDSFYCFSCERYFSTKIPSNKNQEVVLYHIIDDLHARSEMGKEKYGTKLKTHNGRNALMDAYQKALDLCMYLKQALLEQEEK